MKLIVHLLLIANLLELPAFANAKYARTENLERRELANFAVKRSVKAGRWEFELTADPENREFAGYDFNIRKRKHVMEITLLGRSTSKLHNLCYFGCKMPADVDHVVFGREKVEIWPADLGVPCYSAEMLKAFDNAWLLFAKKNPQIGRCDCLIEPFDYGFPLGEGVHILHVFNRTDPDEPVFFSYQILSNGKVRDATLY